MISAICWLINNLKNANIIFPVLARIKQEKIANFVKLQKANTGNWDLILNLQLE
jgi:hypothetical protein